VVVMMLAVAGCAGGDSGSSSNSGVGEPCMLGEPNSAMLVGTSMDPCPQDQCPDDPAVPGTDNDYVTLRVCQPPATPGGMSVWACQCQPKCGNGVKQAGEACDGSDLGGATCMSMGKMGMLSCTAQCTLNDMCAAIPVPTGGAGG
jgi:hypothetical protein